MLAKLERAGLVTASDELQGPTHRRTRTYTITTSGRQRFYQLMLDTAANQAEYQKFFHQKMSAIDLVVPAERLHLFKHYDNFCHTHVLYYEREAADLAHDLRDQVAAHPAYLHNILTTMQHVIDQWAAERQWVQQLIAAEAAS